MLTALFLAPVMSQAALPGTVVYRGIEGPGKGKHIVFLAGDEEYRSEEGLPQLARILATRHGFTCTVVFSMAADGTIDPTVQTDQPGIAALKDADMCVMLLRFRDWPAEQTQFFADYLKSNKPILGLRTSTHAFQFKTGPTEWNWNKAGGFGKQILGETWVNHWGDHGSQATRTVLEPQHEKHPLLHGVDSIFVTTDVYEAHPPDDADIVLRGQVIDGMKPSDPPAKGRKKTAQGVEQDLNDPMMPVLWTRKRDSSHTVTTTMGAATDLLDEGLRRMLVNSVYWQLGLTVPAKADVRLVGDYHPSPFGFGKFKKGVKPADLAGQ